MLRQFAALDATLLFDGKCVQEPTKFVRTAFVSHSRPGSCRAVPQLKKAKCRIYVSVCRAPDMTQRQMRPSEGSTKLKCSSLLPLIQARPL